MVRIKLQKMTLQTLCINAIAKNFEKFHFVFEDAKTLIPKRSFEFLQRQYSTELAAELFKIGDLKEKYLDFLLNEHLKFLDNRWLKNSRYKKNSMNNIFFRLPNLIGIKWDGYYWGITNDEIVENLAKYCPKLVEIRVSSSTVTDDGIKCLCKNEKGKFPCPELKKLEIGSDRLTDEGVKYIILNLPFLEEFQQGNLFEILYLLHKDDLPNLENVRTYNITHLEFHGLYFFSSDDLPYYNDMLKICLKVCPKLKSMRCVITDKEQLHFFRKLNLEDLFLYVLDSNRKIDVNNFLKTHRCKLVSLELWNCIVSINNLTVSCPKLRSLNVRKCIFSSDFADPKSDLHYLNKCLIGGITFDSTTNKAISLFLSCSPKLEELELHYCQLTPKEIGYIIWSQCSLKYIGIFRTFVEIEIAKDILLNCWFLSFLRLESCDFCDSERKVLFELVSKLPNKPKIDFTCSC